MITLSSPCVKSKAPGPSVVPAANANPIAAGHVFTTSESPSSEMVTSSSEKSIYACRKSTSPSISSSAALKRSTAFLNCLSPIMRVLSNSSG